MPFVGLTAAALSWVAAPPNRSRAPARTMLRCRLCPTLMCRQVPVSFDGPLDARFRPETNGETMQLTGCCRLRAGGAGNAVGGITQVR